MCSRSRHKHTCNSGLQPLCPVDWALWLALDRHKLTALGVGHLPCTLSESLVAPVNAVQQGDTAIVLAVLPELLHSMLPRGALKQLSSSEQHRPVQAPIGVAQCNTQQVWRSSQLLGHMRIGCMPLHEAKALVAAVRASSAGRVVITHTLESMRPHKSELLLACSLSLPSSCSLCDALALQIAVEQGVVSHNFAWKNCGAESTRSALETALINVGTAAACEKQSQCVCDNTTLEGACLLGDMSYFLEHCGVDYHKGLS